MGTWRRGVRVDGWARCGWGTKARRDATRPAPHRAPPPRPQGGAPRVRPYGAAAQRRRQPRELPHRERGEAGGWDILFSSPRGRRGRNERQDDNRQEAPSPAVSPPSPRNRPQPPSQPFPNQPTNHPRAWSRRCLSTACCRACWRAAAWGRSWRASSRRAPTRSCGRCLRPWSRRAADLLRGVDCLCACACVHACVRACVWGKDGWAVLLTAPVTSRPASRAAPSSRPFPT
jgi:hypothetical protein